MGKRERDKQEKREIGRMKGMRGGWEEGQKNRRKLNIDVIRTEHLSSTITDKRLFCLSATEWASVFILCLKVQH